MTLWGTESTTSARGIPSICTINHNKFGRGFGGFFSALGNECIGTYATSILIEGKKGGKKKERKKETHNNTKNDTNL